MISLPALREDWPWHVRIYAPTNKGGHLLIETKHRTEASMDAALSRRKRGEVGNVEVVSWGKTEQR